MKNYQNKTWIGLFAILCMSFCLLNAKADASTFDDLSQTEIVEDMGAGWNLGNQLEASDETGQGETLWGNPTITASALDAVKAAGFNTVRIPVSWLYKIGSAPDYTIDSAWLNRVQQVVDYAIDNDMYVLLDLHNDGSISVDGSWILTNASNQDEIRTKLGKVWQQIATRFKDYDEHLIFESMNEVGAESANSEQEIRDAITLINSYNQIFVDTVRQTGGNNTKRWLMVPGWSTNIDYTAGDFGFAVPTDTHRASTIPSSEKRIMISVHYYTPWEFAGQEDAVVTKWGNGESGTITWANESYMEEQFQKMYNAFSSKGYPVVIGEYGAVDKSHLDSTNAETRAYYARSVCKYAKQYGCVPVYWDNGNNGNFGMALFNRHNSYSVTQPTLLSAMMYYYGSGSSSTNITTNNSKLEMELGDTPKALGVTLTPANSKEWVEYGSANSSIASIDRYGNITPKGIGTTTVSASVRGKTATCTVTVTAPKTTRVKLYMQNSSNWTTTESEAYASINGNGTYTLSIKGSRAEMSNITLLYIQDLGAYLGAIDSSLVSSADIKINSVKFNNTSCTLSNDTFQYSNGNGFYIGLLNTWGVNNIENVQKDNNSDGYAFTNVNYQDENTIQVQFTLTNTVMSGNTNSEEQVIFDGSSTSYSTSNPTWLLNADDNDIITVTYKTTNSAEAGWGILGWGGMIDNEWVNGPVYNADTTNPTQDTTVSFTAKSLRNAMGITTNSSVSYLSLSPYSNGVLKKITIQSAS